MLGLGSLFVMDCSKRLDICKASRINSCKRVAKIDHNGLSVPAQQNCKIVYDIGNKIISIEAIRNIKRFEERFCEYGPDYNFNPEELNSSDEEDMGSV